jgi:hypothetical protein
MARPQLPDTPSPGSTVIIGGRYFDDSEPRMYHMFYEGHPSASILIWSKGTDYAWTWTGTQGLSLDVRIKLDRVSLESLLTSSSQCSRRIGKYLASCKKSEDGTFEHVDLTKLVDSTQHE